MTPHSLQLAHRSSSSHPNSSYALQSQPLTVSHIHPNQKAARSPHQDPHLHPRSHLSHCQSAHEDWAAQHS